MALHAQLDDLLDRFLPMVQHFHSQGMLSPHAVTLGSDGEPNDPGARFYDNVVD